ncbi:MAG: tryptophan synthase subunit beta [Alloprevotella sp.]|nr:tryptophan synthase subunit beta [Bacteroidales bacterium]MDY3943623.1 tryptophan synthase subunit beta [Alloprevotella sp.]
MAKNFHVTEDGFYGTFGGAFVPEILKPNIDALTACYVKVIESEAFQTEFRSLLRDYVGRPSPLYLSPSLSELCGCKIYLKREDLNHTGAHKINNAIGQILLARHMGKRRIIAETGAGQHGVATATVCALFGMECTIYMGAVDIERQRPNVEKMRLLGAKVIPATSGNQTLKDAVNEALRDWCSHPEETFYLLGSAVGPHPYPDLVARLQSIISEEVRQQLLEKEGTELPNYAIACVGGGSNAAGSFFHFLDEEKVKLVIAEASGHGVDTAETAATLTLGTEGVLHGSRSLVMQDEDGQVIEPYSISAGLDYPGVGPLHAELAQSGRASVITVTDDEALEAAYDLNRKEGILPAIESAHTLASLRKVKFQPTDIVVATLSGRGDKDIDTYLKHAVRFGYLSE